MWPTTLFEFGSVSRPVEDEAGARAGRSGRRPGNIAVVLPPPWLFGEGMDNVFLKVNALKML